MSELDTQVRRLRRRVRLLLAERYALLGGSAGAVVASVMVLLSPRFAGLLDYRLWIGTALAGLVAGASFGLLTKLSDLTVAISADKRIGMKERISTAVALESRTDRSDVEETLIRDAGRHIETFRSTEVFRHRFGRMHIALACSLALLMGIVFLPRTGIFLSKTRQQEIAAMKQQGKKMVKVAKDMKKLDPRDEELRKLAARMEQLGKKMQTGRMEKKQAMLKTRRLGEQIAAKQDKLARMNKPMEKAQSEMRKASDRIARSMAEKIAQAEKITPEAAMKKLPSDAKLAELARKDGSLTAAERGELEKALEKYADPASSLPIPKELAEALAKLAANGDYQKAVELMQKLAKKQCSGGTCQADKEALKKQMGALAKALKNTDLDALAKALRENAERLAKMSPEELEKLAKQAQCKQCLSLAMSKACGACAGIGTSSANGPGGGMGGDDSNTGPKGELKEVKKTVLAPSQIGESGTVFSSGETMGVPDTAAPSTVPYTEVYSEYRKAAEDALSKENVPPAYRKRVKDYFSSLE
ncbi:MAG: hypothetical protein ACYC2Y_00125 [Armatimonadota bacterium]